MYKAKIYIAPKKSVLDPQGKVVHHALESLGFQGVDEVRVGKFVELKVDSPDKTTAAARVKEMCEGLLVNAVVEEYTFELLRE